MAPPFTLAHDDAQPNAGPVASPLSDSAAEVSRTPLPRDGFAPRKVTLNRPQQLLELACRVVPAASSLLAVLSDEDELAEFLSAGLSTESVAAIRQSPPFLELLQIAPARGTPHHWTDAAREFPWLGLLPGLASWGPLLAFPFHCSNRCRGVLCLTRASGQPRFGAADDEIVRALTGWLEQGNLLEETRLLDQLRLLSQVAQAAAGNLDLSRIVSVSLAELDRYLPLHGTAVWLVDERPRPDPALPDTSQVDAAIASPALSSPTQLLLRPHGPPPAAPPAFGSPDGAAKSPGLILADLSVGFRERASAHGLTPGFRIALAHTPLRICLHEGQPFYSDAVRPHEHAAVDCSVCLGEPRATSCFAIPLRAGDRVVGVLHSVCTRPSGFSVEQIQLLYLVADLLGPAISNCQLFDQVRQAYEDLRLAQGQLIQTEKMRALGELASGMAHEFNNALCGVLGFLELALLKGNLDSACRGFLESGRTCALDAAHVVRRVQDFARWQRNSSGFHPLDFNDLVCQTVELIRHKWENLIRARGTPVNVEVRTEGTARVSGDAAELREVLTNLSFNAVDAMPEGGNLTLRTWTTATHVFLAVRDTGMGMSEAVKKRLFEPFFTTKGDKGNGLGLSVSFGIVQRHGGGIDVESRLHQGTTFTIRLPLLLDDAVANKTERQPAIPAPATRCLRILVVEDEEMIRRYLATGLETLGHQTRLTANGEEALAAFAQEQFDVVLTDLGLPGISGEDVARGIVAKSPKTPVVLLTGWADQLQAECATLEGVVRVLSKPISLESLATTLTAVCPNPLAGS